MVDAARPVALHVAVPAHRRWARALAADVAAQREQVDDLADGVDPVLLLGQPEAPADDRPRRGEVAARDVAHLLLAYAALAHEILPRRARDERAVLLEAGGEALEEPEVEDLGILRRPFEHGLGDAAQEREVARDPRLHVQRAHRGRAEGRHLHELVRDDGRARARLDHRVDVDDLGAAAIGLRERREHARRVRRRVDPHHEDQVRLVPIGEIARALARAQRRLQPTAAGLVAHVRAVRQVVRAELTHPELIEEGRLVAQPSRRVERRLVGRVETAQGLPHQREGIGPRDGHVLVGPGVVGHRLDQAPLGLQGIVTPRAQLAHGVGGEELARHAPAGQLPRDVLDAVLAEVQLQAVLRVRPRAARAVEAAVLVVHLRQHARSLERLARAHEHLGHRPGRAPPGGRMLVVDLLRSARARRPATEGRKTRCVAEHASFSKRSRRVAQRWALGHAPTPMGAAGREPATLACEMRVAPRNRSGSQRGARAVSARRARRRRRRRPTAPGSGAGASAPGSGRACPRRRRGRCPRPRAGGEG